MPAATVLDLLLVLDTYFPAYLPISQALLVLATVLSLSPILILHQRQRAEPNQPRTTAWLTAATRLIKYAFLPPGFDEGDDVLEDADMAQTRAAAITRDLYELYEHMGIDTNGNPHSLLPELPNIILLSPHASCTRCPPTTRFRSLRHRTKAQDVRVLDGSFTWRKAVFLVGHCQSCHADHYPDRITYRGTQGERLQRLEYDAKYIRISKHGLWVDRRVALAQENAVREFRAGWSNFAKWVSAMVPEGPAMTYCQSRRLFIEHFGRRLLLSHGHSASFSCPANLDTSMFAGHLCDTVGKDGGVLADALHHGCMDCTHRKRYRTDLLDEGAVLDDDPESAGMAQAADVPNLPDVHSFFSQCAIKKQDLP